MILDRTPSIELPDWDMNSATQWAEMNVRATHITSRAGMGANFARTRAEVCALIDAGDEAGILFRLTNRRFARALATVWAEDKMRAEASATDSILAALLEKQAPRVSRLTTLALIRAYLGYFDEMEDWPDGTWARFGNTVRSAVMQQPPREGAGDIIEALRTRPEFFFEKDGPEQLAAELQASGISLDHYLRNAGAIGFENGRYGLIVRHALYIEQIKHADPLSDHDFLDEISTRGVYEFPTEDGMMFGHALLTALIQRSDAVPAEPWLRTVFNIAGDPRLRHTSAYRRWWALLPNDLVARVIRWLSAEDLRLFLQAVEQFGYEGNVSDLQRLFPPRKQFLWGLYESGLVRETRLILGENALGSIRRTIGKPLKTDVAAFEGNNSADTAIIFLDCGEFQIVEGSHYFKMWCYVGDPDETLIDRQRRRFNRSDLIHSLPARHAQSSPLGFRGHEGFAHQGFWQHKPIQFLTERGIRLNIEALLTPRDYIEYKSRFGLPTARRW
ncbi:EH signature domain-containing protein [Salinibacterium sp. ZJ454]|uniref:EH signature domain-containing protein n=1 Tax=Salinibacterium sp. ZJ454 TaxID=2708339 RepID=UPI00141EC849|nr:EH signature domain-containing protein [Salinibacterium sp. ZJ454]